MSRITRALLGAALVAGAAAPAGAQVVSVGGINFGTICGSDGAGIEVCAVSSVEVFKTYAGASVTSQFAQVTLQNAEALGIGVAHRITGIGVYYLQGPSMGVGTLANPIPAGGWQNGFNGGGGSLDNPGPKNLYAWLLASTVPNKGGGGGLYGCTPVGGGAVSSCPPDSGPITFRFDFATTDQIRVGELKFAFRSQSIEGGDEGSIKCYTTDPASSDHACAPFITTPEPATVALMATGLLGVFGVTLRRRRIEA